MTSTASTPSQTPQATPRDNVKVDEGFQTVVNQWQSAAAQQLGCVSTSPGNDSALQKHSNQLPAIQRSLLLRSRPTAANTSVTRLHEEYQSVGQACSHLIRFIGFQQEGDQYGQTLQQTLAAAQAELVNAQGREQIRQTEAGVSQLGQERFRSGVLRAHLNSEELECEDGSKELLVAKGDASSNHVKRSSRSLRNFHLNTVSHAQLLELTSTDPPRGITQPSHGKAGFLLVCSAQCGTASSWVPMHQDKHNNSQFPTLTISFGDFSGGKLWVSRPKGLHPRPSNAATEWHHLRDSTISHAHGWSLTPDAYTWWNSSLKARLFSQSRASDRQSWNDHIKPNHFPLSDCPVCQESEGMKGDRRKGKWDKPCS
eukprot:4120054-Amphidinium_carterae.3